ncbi:unnamed protein product, partial [Polarella glacialis]
DDEHLWVRTEVRKGSDLIDGQAWMAEFQVRVGAHLEKAAGDPLQPGPNFFLRNRVLREMGKTCPPGKRLRLPTGQDVIFWFNVGIPGPPKSRVYVTEARCPHQGVCLLGGELSEIEDEMGIAQAMIRCPRHNKTFSLRHGRSHGNTEVLREFPCRFMHGHWYVGLDLDEPGTPAAASSFKEPLSPGSEGKAGRPTLQCTEAQDSSPSSDPTRKKLRWLFDTLVPGFIDSVDNSWGCFSLDKMALRTFCRNAELDLCVQSLWDCLDTDRDGAVCMQDVTPKGALALASLRAWSHQKCGSCVAVWDLPALAQSRFQPREKLTSMKKMLTECFMEAVKVEGWPGSAKDRSWKGQAQLCSALDKFHAGMVSKEDLAWLDSWEPPLFLLEEASEE